MRNPAQPVSLATLPRYPPDGVQLCLPFPPRPGIKRDVCPYCHSVHMTADAVAECRESQ